jgi:hypothetical protein
MGLSRIRLARQQQKIARSTAGFLIGLVILLIGGAILGSTLLLSHLRTTTTIVSPIRGGTWTYGIGGNVHSLIPNGTNDGASTLMDQALYLPPLLWRCPGCDPRRGGNRGTHHPEWRCERRCDHLDLPSATAPRVVGWAALRCARRGLHLEALGQSQVRGCHYAGAEPDQLDRGLGGPPVDHLPPQATLRTISGRPVGGWHICSAAGALFQQYGSRSTNNPNESTDVR